MQSPCRGIQTASESDRAAVGSRQFRRDAGPYLDLTPFDRRGSIMQSPELAHIRRLRPVVTITVKRVRAVTCFLDVSPDMAENT